MVASQQVVSATSGTPSRARAARDAPNSADPTSLAALLLSPTLSHADALTIAELISAPLDRTAEYYRHLALASTPPPPFLPTAVDPGFAASVPATLKAVMGAAKLAWKLAPRRGGPGGRGDVADRGPVALAVAHGALLPTLGWIRAAFDEGTMRRWGVVGPFPADASSTAHEPAGGKPGADVRAAFLEAFVLPLDACMMVLRPLEEHAALRRRLARRPDYAEASALLALLADPVRALFEQKDWMAAPDEDKIAAMRALAGAGTGIAMVLHEDPGPVRAYRLRAANGGRRDLVGALCGSLGRLAWLAERRGLPGAEAAGVAAGLLAAAIGVRGREGGWATQTSEAMESGAQELMETKRQAEGPGTDRCDACGRPESGGKLMWCARCGFARYCSRECQRGDWKAGHGKGCAGVPVPGFGQGAKGGAIGGGGRMAG